MQIDLTLHVRETYVVPAASAKIAGSFRRACYDITIEAFARVTGPLCSSFAYLNRNAVHIVAKTTPWMTHDRHPIDHCVAVFDSIHRLFAYSLHHTVFILHSVCPRSCDLFFPRSLSLSLSLSLFSIASAFWRVSFCSEFSWNIDRGVDTNSNIGSLR